jgi:dinuclear metal center YbgI/SA1388 family protein
MPNDPADSCDRARLVSAADALLQPARFKDYGPNGLQVEGKPQIRKLVSGVTASLALIDAAIEHGADAIFVHHGLFWRGQDGRVTGWMKQRLAKLLAHDINLLAYHLPLDAHPELGNNAQLAQRLGLSVQGHFGEQDLGLWGEPQNPDPGHFLAWAQRELGREPVLVQHRLVLGRRAKLF